MKCRLCKGKKYIWQIEKKEKEEGGEYRSKKFPCPECHGTGKQIK